ncbi:N-6 DNA methylase [Arcanobacterium pinnipediorum]|uniref:site-specific DNA-methyltransferase (adenine-specific) n=1 Tax=Arcanobacterium pinnipediorum TaxID=1503041 RepID=A0ABY5AIG9_9ACTO|nr:N-6 DNA methylase [Arcanobacterium pinnipediorum]USR79998.1 N-6 DNA methylase [Arcanobacterium pinnipediorum]
MDVDDERIHYPVEQGMRVARQTTTDFSHNESFVVLECVDRLLEKGYRPEDIELEKKWSLGHRLTGGEDSGFADICVYSRRQTPEEVRTVLFIIECKTFGREFDIELKNMMQDGGQLFSYWQQERASQYLVLYASDIVDDTIRYRTETVVCQDDPNILKLAEKDTDETIRLYKQARSVTDLFEAWSETYEKRLVGDVIFRDDSSAYDPDVKPLRKRDLRDFSENDKVVNRFEEILRHNNVSDKENAFNRLIALFICKLVDEMQKGDDDEVEFQYKVGTDTYESLQDRLQRLHKEGMERFMREKIFYVPDDYAETVVQQYAGKRRENLIKELRDTLRVLKFFTNNDFAFKDVHNEELFYQNGKIVVEMVQLFEHYRIIGSSDIQTLGDLFEQLLNKGFKQNEGQFFTPVPITRFIWDALPIQKVIATDKGIDYPKVIDYACGAGHFLTQGVEAVNSAVHELQPEADTSRSWVATKIYGVEKDYRLARVSKISLFMHGASDANIIFGDGLENYPDKGIEAHTFDVLVANPPYAVKAFKSHMKLKNNDFQIIERISNDGSEIETLFVERIAQLLKPSGVAAVILPSSILSNDSTTYTAAREQLLQNFYIRAIAGFGSKTFGATGTNTVILFLERIEEPPVRFKLVADSAEAIRSGAPLDEWEDQDIYDAYLSQIEISTDEYQLFIAETEPYQHFRDTNYLKNYVTAFENQTHVKAKKKQKTFQRLTTQEQQRWLDREFYKYVKDAEFTKIQYFAMVYQQTVLVITAPTDNGAQKEFLGYDWSNRKGNEGISITKPGGMLYNPDNRFDNNTLAGLVRGTFDSTQRVLETHKDYYQYIPLKDMIDFSRVSFNQAMNLSVSSKTSIDSKYPLFPLGEKVEVKIGGTPARAIDEYFHGSNLWVSISEMNGQVITDTKEKITDEAVQNSNVKLIPKGTTLLSFKLSIGKTAIAGEDLYTNEAIAALIPKTPEILDSYLFALFSSGMIDLQNTGNKAFGKSLNSAYLRSEVSIPVPPKDIQETIVHAFQIIDEEYQNTRMTIEDYRAKIEKLFADLEVIRGGKP